MVLSFVYTMLKHEDRLIGIRRQPFTGTEYPSL